MPKRLPFDTGRFPLSDAPASILVHAGPIEVARSQRGRLRVILESKRRCGFGFLMLLLAVLTCLSMLALATDMNLWWVILPLACLVFVVIALMEKADRPPPVNRGEDEKGGGFSRISFVVALPGDDAAAHWTHSLPAFA